MIRISELLNEQLRYVILMRFNLSGRPILNNMSGSKNDKVMEKLLFSP